MRRVLELVQVREIGDENFRVVMLHLGTFNNLVTCSFKPFTAAAGHDKLGPAFVKMFACFETNAGVSAGDQNEFSAEVFVKILL